MQQTRFDVTLASRGDRLAGQFFDGIVGGALLIAGLAASTVAKTPGFAVIAAGVLWSIVYNLFADGLKDGQSIGKRQLGTRVVDAKTGAPCTYGQSFVRNAFQILGPLDWIFIFGEERQRLGDKVAGTVVICD